MISNGHAQSRSMMRQQKIQNKLICASHFNVSYFIKLVLIFRVPAFDWLKLERQIECDWLKVIALNCSVSVYEEMVLQIVINTLLF